jgi:hypothetical protein
VRRGDALHTHGIGLFDHDVWSYCSWSNLAAQGANSEHDNSSTAMVVLADGTVHFMEFRMDSPLGRSPADSA